jgi:antirestriction protein ArdC
MPAIRRSARTVRRTPIPSAEPTRNTATVRTNGATKTTKTQRDLYTEVTASIVADLEAGRVPWVQPWGEGEGTVPGLPRNAASGRPYSGINILILWRAAIDAGYSAQSWLTFRQAAAAGGMVRRGEHGVTVYYADRFVPEQEKQRAEAVGDEARAVPFLKRFTLFNVAQCEGVDPALTAAPAPVPLCQQVPAAEAVIAASGVPFRVGGAEAYYSPARDLVVVPPQAAFFAPINWYRTALHELTHATGHPARLARDLSNGFGTPGYAREELVALSGQSAPCLTLH